MEAHSTGSEVVADTNSKAYDEVNWKVKLCQRRVSYNNNCALTLDLSRQWIR